MKKYSDDKFEFKSQLNSHEIIDRLSNRTLTRKTLVMVLTDKDFIGRVEQNSFTIIDSSYPLPYGAICIIKGTIGPASQIVLTTTLHKAFRLLFLIWIILMTTFFVIFCILDSIRIDELIVIVIVMTVMTLLFRMFLHVMYVVTRNNGLKKIKTMLEVVD